MVDKLHQPPCEMFRIPDTTPCQMHTKYFRWFYGVSLATYVAACSPPPPDATPHVSGRVVAVGVTGASAISRVGSFLSGPMQDNAGFKGTTAEHEILAPNRILVASSSNFGAPVAVTSFPSGSILSIDPSSTELLVIDPQFATAGGQASMASGMVRLFTAQAKGFENRLNNTNAVTGDMPTVTYPTGISLNNGFGRPWFSNTTGVASGGIVSVCDPSGISLANAPSQTAGGIFQGDKTNRAPQAIEGSIKTDALATALLGRSPDQGGRAVFAAVLRDGSIVQVHVERGVDGLAPPGTITPIPETHAVDRVGMVFNWVPDRILFISDPLANTIVKVTLTDDGSVFHVQSIERIELAELQTPVDLSPAVSEIANQGFASNTTLAGGADLYVANQGNGHLLRIDQTGNLISEVAVDVPDFGIVGATALKGISSSEDARFIYATISGSLTTNPDHEGIIVEVPAFGAPELMMSELDTVSMTDNAARLFEREFEPREGLGPLFNDRSCRGCHREPQMGGVGGTDLGSVLFVGRRTIHGFDPLENQGGPVARRRSIAELGMPTDVAPGIPEHVNITSVRISPPLFDIAAFDEVPTNVILAGIKDGTDGITGRPNWIIDDHGNKRIGRFGWKAHIATLSEQVAHALRNEMGITTALAPRDLTTKLEQETMNQPEDRGMLATSLNLFLVHLKHDTPSTSLSSAGSELFRSVGCASCHTPQLRTWNSEITVYSDLLLHDLGPSLDDGIMQEQARGRDWRTAPLRGLSFRTRFLHDGRATTLTQAIFEHDGEAASTIDRYAQLSADQRETLMAFLRQL